ncbi:MAG TPA: hypothetical protein VH165_05125 [Kofleriaceae bacterium]|nr:hypothetical protein [Kofleriaceae bacterium]
MTAEKVDELVKCGCPVRAAEVLLSSRQARTRSLLHGLEQGRWILPLPATSPVCDALRARIEHEPSTLSPQPGVYALSVQHVAGEDLGLVERLVPTSTAPTSADDFTRGAAMGEHRARDWLTRVWGPLQELIPSYFTLERIPPLPGRTGPADLRGDSVGLAAALATVWRLWSPATYVAATGQVDADGRIVPVELMEPKLKGLRREAPFIDRVLVPWSVHFDGRTVRDGLEIIPVRTVDEALDLVFGSAHVKLALMPPLDAAHEAVRLELAREHDLANNYAAAAFRGLDDHALPKHDRELAQALATAVNAINLTHQGQAKLAEPMFQQIEPMLSTGLRANPRAQIAAMRASKLIDVLEFDAAVAVCEQCDPILDFIEPASEVMVRGSWTRALTAARRLDEAQAQAIEQCSVKNLRLSDRNQLVQAYCNLIDVELKLHARGEAKALTRASAALQEAARSNVNGGPAALEESQRFLAYWEARIFCAGGHLDEARQRTSQLAKGRFPGQLLLRYLAEAYRRRGGASAALDVLVRARTTVSAEAKGFERIVLLSSTPMESRLRQEQSLPDVRDPALEFATLLDNWKPGFIQWPRDRDNNDAWIAALEDAASRLPY